MIDFVLGICFAALALRGWIRGFVKEVLDLVGLVLGVAVAFRLSAPFGDFFSDRFGATPEWARLGAGIVLFVLVGLAMALIAHWLGKVMRLPGLNLSNRLLGAGFAVGWALVIVLLLAGLARALPMPPVVDDTLDQSQIVAAITDPEAPTQRVFRRIVGDSVLGALLALEPLIGDRRLVLDEDQMVETVAADPEQIALRPGDVEEMFGFLNDARLAERRDPLAWSDGLAEVARGHAEDMYLNGFVSHVSPTTGEVVDRVEAAGIRLHTVGENLALAASTRAAHAALMESDGHRENILRTSFDRVGVAVVDGPLGLMVVEVFGGQVGVSSGG